MMEPIVVKHEVENVPIPVIGFEPALQSNNRNLDNKQLASKELDTAEIEGDNKLSCIAILAYYKAEARGYEPGHEMQDWLDAEAEIMEKNKGEN